ncbi:MAG TPA: hypothetical protein VGY54_21020 [Polyangiaceae bacterium]|nr:hypothetical protein [Polyangiaceae bacterium]
MPSRGSAPSREFGSRTPLSDFDQALNAIFDRIEENAHQFGEHGLLAVPNGRTLLYPVRRAILPGPFPYVVFFYVRQANAIVLAIAHGRRRPGYWARRR